MDPQQALQVLSRATADPSLKLSRQDHQLVMQALAVLQQAIAPPAAEPEDSKES